jgi:4-hydroxy-tetrahydrodipicolinate reductase
LIKVCLAGATGWAGSELARGVARTSDLTLVGAIGRRHVGERLGDILGEPKLSAAIFASVEEALATTCDVFVEYTKADAAKANVLAALEHGAHVVIGTSGLTDADFAEIDVAARRVSRGVLACGNFALTVVLLQRFAEMAARIIPQWEIIDYASDAKTDAPSGTARELATRLARVREPSMTVPIVETVGPTEARGATLNGSQVHSLRLPSFVISAEIIFGMQDQRLVLRHDSGSSAIPYVEGALLAIRRVGTLIGLHRGLDTVLEF